MYIIMFHFVIKEGLEQQFLTNWTKTTKGIKAHFGSLGSRLHKNERGDYIAYAQWPSKQHWIEHYQRPLPKEYEQARQLMRDALDSERTQIIQQMEVVNDLLV